MVNHHIRAVPRNLTKTKLTRLHTRRRRVVRVLITPHVRITSSTPLRHTRCNSTSTRRNSSSPSCSTKRHRPPVNNSSGHRRNRGNNSSRPSLPRTNAQVYLRRNRHMRHQRRDRHRTRGNSCLPYRHLRTGLLSYNNVHHLGSVIGHGQGKITSYYSTSSMSSSFTGIAYVLLVHFVYRALTSVKA